MDFLPWDRQTSEPLDDYEAFRVYLDALGHMPTTMARTGRTLASLCEARARWRWIARRAAYVRHLAEESTQAAEESARAMGVRHAQFLRSMLEHAQEALIVKATRGPYMEDSEIRQWAKTAIELERLVKGEASARVALDLKNVPQGRLDALSAALDALDTPEPVPTPPEPTEAPEDPDAGPEPC